MRRQGNRNDDLALTPNYAQPLLSSDLSAEWQGARVDSMADPSAVVSVCAASARGLRPLHKNFTSHTMVEVSLVPNLSGNNMPPEKASALPQRTKSFANMSSSHNAQAVASFKSEVVKSSLNPIWELNADFGEVDAATVSGVRFVVRHIEKMGFIKKDLGIAQLSLRDIFELRQMAPEEREYALEPTMEMRSHGMDANRNCGSIFIRYNQYGITGDQRKQSTESMPAGLGHGLSQSVPNLSNNTMVAHEDDFSRSLCVMKNDVRAEFRKLKSVHRTTPLPGQTWYAVEAGWIANWLCFVTKHKGKEAFHPGPVDNMPLISDAPADGTLQVRQGLSIKRDFRLINKESWRLYKDNYGGSPEIEVAIPEDCVDTDQFIAEMDLYDVARVSTSYCTA